VAETSLQAKKELAVVFLQSLRDRSIPMQYVSMHVVELHPLASANDVSSIIA